MHATLTLLMFSIGALPHFFSIDIAYQTDHAKSLFTKFYCCPSFCHFFSYLIFPLTLSQNDNLLMTISNLMKMVESFPDGYKTLWEKEILFVTSNFSFPRVFSKDFYCRHIKTRAYWERVHRSNTNYPPNRVLGS